MKKIITMFVLSCCMFFVHAQQPDSAIYIDIPKFKIGFRAGANFAQISGSGAQGFNHFGAVGGMFFDYRIKKRMSLITELTYTMKGARRNPNPDFGDYNSYSFDLDYIELPVLFRYHVGKKEFVSFDAGLTFAFLVRQVGKENGSVIKFDRGFNVFELGIAAGVNFHLPKGWGITARYHNSIIPIRSNINNNTVIQPIWGIVNIGQVNSLFSASLTYCFGVGKKTEKVLAPSLQPKTSKTTKVNVVVGEEKQEKTPMFQKIEKEEKAPKPKKEKRPRGEGVYDED